MQVILISSDDEPDGEEALGATAGESTGSKNNSVNRNVYYHAHRRCVEMKYEDFDPETDLKIYSDVKESLSVVHLEYISEEFGVDIS